MIPGMVTPDAFVALMAKLRTGEECDFTDTDPYKPIYGALALLLAPGYHSEVYGGPRTDFISIEQALEFLSQIPYFDAKLAVAGHRETFESTYEFIREAWEG